MYLNYKKKTILIIFMDIIKKNCIILLKQRGKKNIKNTHTHIHAHKLLDLKN